MTPPGPETGGDPLDITRKRWGRPEEKALKRALSQPSLFYWRGALTEELLGKFRLHTPTRHAVACSSGTAALHLAVAATQLQPGDEVIVPPITDMGTVIGILLQQAVPVFADVDARTFNLDPNDVAKKITPKTRAIIAVHLMGNPCDMHALRAIADDCGAALIEDCAQAWGSKYEGQPVGTLGDMACFSFNDFKHIGCGDGGIVATNSAEHAAFLGKFADKGYDRINGVRSPDILAPNYRITELQSAVASAQLDRVVKVALTHHRCGTRLATALGKIPGFNPQSVRRKDYSTYWYLLSRYDAAQFTCTRNEFVENLKVEGIVVGAGYLPAPMYRFPVFQNHSFFGGTWPLRDSGLTSMDYRNVSCPVAEQLLDEMIGIKLHESLNLRWADAVSDGFHRVASRCRIRAQAA